MPEDHAYSFHPIGFVRSSLTDREEAPLQGQEGAPEAWLDIDSSIGSGLEGISVGDEVILLTWLHKSRRDVLKLHPRRDEGLPLIGVFATRSPDRPNPIGLHWVRVIEIAANQLKVGPLEAINGTPLIDIKPVIAEAHT